MLAPLRSSLASVVVVFALALGSGCDEPVPTEDPCGPLNCNGCCTVEGTCLPGTTETACGAGGTTCAVCIASQSCVATQCVLLIGDGGTLADAGLVGAAGAEGDAGTTTDAGVVEDGGVVADGGTESDAGVVTDAGTFSDGGAIVAPPQTWTWIDFPDAVCGNGSATGLGVNLSSTSTDVFVYLEGGGACWEEYSCFVFGTAANLTTGYDGADFAAQPFRSAFAVDRSQPTNPFKDMSYVYIPYCTGDVHGGDAIRTYGTRPPVHHKGAKNIEAFLKRLVPTFPNASRIFFGGSSAGAFGAQLNYERVVAAFPGAEVHVLADSGQMINPSGTRLNDWLNAWNLTLPAGCPTCTTDFTLFPQYLATTYPARRFALTAYTQDDVLRQFFGYTAADYQTQTLSLLANRYDPYPNARYFLLAGADHTMLGRLPGPIAPSGTSLNTFLTQWVNGDPAWADVKP